MNPVSLGPLTSKLKAQASWTDAYPAWQSYADESERLLSFLETHGQVNRFSARLSANNKQRDEALNEVRVAYLFESLGYPIISWEPTDATPFNVEFAVSVGSGNHAFVEVKSPGWESELTKDERDQGRKREPKYLDIEARTGRPIQIIQRTVEKARPKFSGRSPSLLVIADDCFVNLGIWGWGPLQMALTQNSIAWGPGLFNGIGYEKIGGVCLFWLGNDIRYRSICLKNPNAMPSAALPPGMAANLTTEPQEPSLRVPQQGIR